VVEEQIHDLDVQMQDLDDFVSRAKSHNASHHERHGESVQGLTGTVEQSFSNISGHFKQTFERVQTLGDEMDTDAKKLEDALEPLDENVCQPLAELREDVQNTELREYEPTGDTPEKIQYQYPTDLPRTGAHEDLLAAMRESPTPSKPSPAVLPDINLTPVRSPTRPPTGSGSPKSPLAMSLREVNPNLTSPAKFDPSVSVLSSLAPPVGGGGGDASVPLLKSAAGNMRTRASRLSKRIVGMGAVGEGAENVPPPAVMRSSTRRKSPRLH
jgi:kinesin family protein 11